MNTQALIEKIVSGKITPRQAASRLLQEFHVVTWTEEKGLPPDDFPSTPYEISLYNRILVWTPNKDSYGSQVDARLNAWATIQDEVHGPPPPPKYGFWGDDNPPEPWPDGLKVDEPWEGPNGRW